MRVSRGILTMAFAVTGDMANLVKVRDGVLDIADKAARAAGCEVSGRNSSIEPVTRPRRTRKAKEAANA